MSPITITKATRVELDTTKILDSINFAKGEDLTKVDSQKVYDQVVNSLYDGISTDEIIELSIKVAETYIPSHYQYSELAARLMLQKLYKEVLGESIYEDEDFYSSRYVGYFDEYLEKGIGMKLIDPALKDYDLNTIKAAIVPQSDLIFKEVGMGRVYKQYLLKTNENPQKVFELPQFWLMRVAMGLSKLEKNKEEVAIEYYNLLSNQKVLNSTPTLLNSGRVRNQCSSCFLLTTDDSLEHIYKTYSDIAFLSKYAGGIGVDFNNIRATGSLIKGTNGKSLGLIPFLKVLDSSAAAVNQGGVRQGAVAAYIEPWHKDVFDFLSSKYMGVSEERRSPHIHTVLWIPDLFMKRLEVDGKWTLFSPSDVPELHDLHGPEFEEKYEAYEQDPNTPKEIIPIRKLWEEVLTSLLGKGFGHPWITWKDPSNALNTQDHVGVVHSSNLCTEILLPTSRDETAVCNLASINLSKFVKEPVFGKNLATQEALDNINWNDLKDTIKVVIRALDNVIDVNFYTTKEAENANKKHRPIGLGVMGWQDMLQKLGVTMESDTAVQISDQLFEFISYNSISTSSDLASEKGQYSTYEGSKWSRGIFPIEAYKDYAKKRGYPVANNFDMVLDWSSLKAKVAQTGLRNSQQLAIAPTRSISYIAATSPSIEPWDSNIFTEVGMTGKYQMINSTLIDELESLGLWSPDVIEKIKIYDGSIQFIAEIPEHIRAKYKTAWEIHPKWLIAQNARRQKWVDMGISFNMWLSNNNGKDAERLYMECWKAGFKTTYYLHSKSKSQASKMSLANMESSEPIRDTFTSSVQIKTETETITIDNPEGRPIMKNGEVCDMTDPDCEACQ
ncbi:MAG: ribonucleoside-diphosphate reductase subunit alpha [bacterium]